MRTLWYYISYPIRLLLAEVLSQREVVKLITGGRESGNLKQYLQSRALETTLPTEIRNNFTDNLLIIRSGSTSVNGVKAATIIDICNELYIITIMRWFFG